MDKRLQKFFRAIIKSDLRLCNDSQRRKFVKRFNIPNLPDEGMVDALVDTIAADDLEQTADLVARCVRSNSTRSTNQEPFSVDVSEEMMKAIQNQLDEDNTYKMNKNIERELLHGKRN